METLEGGGLHPDAFLQTLFPQIRTPGPGGDRDPDRVRASMQTALAFADEDDRSDVTLFELIGADGVEARLRYLFGGERDFQTQDVSRIEQAVVVLGQPEDGGAAVLTGVAANSLEHADAVVQSMGEDMYLGLVPGHQRAVHPNLTVVHGVLLRKSILQIRTPGESQPEPAGRLTRIEWRRQNGPHEREGEKDKSGGVDRRGQC